MQCDFLIPDDTGVRITRAKCSVGVGFRITLVASGQGGVLWNRCTCTLCIKKRVDRNSQRTRTESSEQEHEQCRKSHGTN